MEDLSGWFPGFTVQEAFDEFIAEHAEQDSSQENDYDPVCRAALAAKRTRNSSSRIRPVLKKSAPWQLMLDANAAGKNTIHDERSRDGKYFRRRFRMPYTLFKALIKTMLDEQVGSRYSSFIAITSPHTLHETVVSKIWHYWPRTSGLHR